MNPFHFSILSETNYPGATKNPHAVDLLFIRYALMETSDQLNHRSAIHERAI
jgi:hypothetical protein